MNPVERFGLRATPRYVVVGRVVFEIQQARTVDLVANGYTTIVGVGEARQALDRAKVEEDALVESFDAGDPKGIEARKQKGLARLLKKQVEQLDELRTDVNKAVEFGAQMHAYVAAGLTRIGVLAGTGPDPDVEGAEAPVPEPEWWMGPDHRELMPDGWTPTQWLHGSMQLARAYAKPPTPRPDADETVHDVARRRSRDHGELWTGLLDPVEVSTLFHAIRGISGGRARRVAGFRWPSRNAPDA